ncbi:hypothetical protein LDENG_00106290 [Lucifuga dentata]|nr:hypothetical protein LDENG_00106290 [Lucifuga dentata]
MSIYINTLHQEGSDSQHYQACRRLYLNTKFTGNYTNNIRMDPSVFACGLFLLMIGPAVPMCIPTDFTLYVEKPGCDFCVAINTTSCMGLCYSRDSNMRGILRPRFLIQKGFLIQNGCTYEEVEYRTVILPGCSINADRVFTYPVALSCHCGACRTDSNECTHRAIGHGAQCTKSVRFLA